MSVMQKINDFLDNYIKPNICGFLIVGAGVYFVTPRLNPMLGRIPLNPNIRAALLAGGYSIVGMTACDMLKLGSLL